MATDAEHDKGSLNNYYLIGWALLWLLAMHYMQNNVGGAGLALPFNSSSWIAVSIVIAVGLWQVALKGRFEGSRQDLILACTLVALALPLLWSEPPWRQQSYDRYIALLAMWLVICGHRQFALTTTQTERLYSLVIVAGLFQTALCLVQFFFAEQLVWVDGYRPRGTFQQTNLVATFIGTAMAIALYQASKSTLSPSSKYLPPFMLSLGACVLVLIASRTGVLGTSIALIWLTALLGWRKTARNWLYIALGVTMGALLTTSVEESGRSDSITAPGYRATLYSLSAELITERPISGWGLGKFQAVYMERQARHQAEGSAFSYWNQGINHPHNELLFWGVEGGILPLVSLLIMGILVSYRTWRYGNRHTKAIWLCALPIALHTQTELPLYLSAPHLALLAILVSECEPGPIKTIRISATKLLRFAAPGLVLIVSGFMITNLHAIQLLYEAPTTPNAFIKIVNPIGQQKRINELLSQVLSVSENPSARKAAEDMARNEATLRPSVGSYRILANVLHANGKPQESEEVVIYARYLFPGDPAFSDAYVLPEDRNEPISARN